MRSMQIATYSLIVILLKDIELPQSIHVRRLVFEDRVDCLRVALALDQERDPIVRKKQCRTNYTYER